MALAATRNWILGSSLLIYRVLTWAVLAGGLLFGATVLVLRYWILPDISSHRETIARVLSDATQQKIGIGGISANWDGLRPQLALSQVVVHDAAGRPALELPRVDATLSWRSAARLQVNFHSLDIHSPSLTVRRDSRGGITVAGIAMNLDAGDGSGFSDWLLSQRDIEIHDARLIWDDGMRAAPVLELERLQLRIVNSGNRHRIGLRAVPPAALASPLDLRADLRGEDFRSLSSVLNGQLFVQVDHVDIAAWRQWIDFPVHFPQGQGALRAWLTFGGNELLGVIADTQLREVKTRLGNSLPELDMRELGGRFSWKRSGDGMEIATSKLAFVTGDGLVLPAVDFLLRLNGAGEPGHTRGELQANALELAPLVQLADRLPLDAELRRSLTAYSPAGSLYDVSLRWNGAWPKPATYALRGRFHELSLRRHGALPGFSGFSGNIDGTEKGGTLHVATQKAVLELPQLFRDRLQLETLSGQLAWSQTTGGTELRFSNFAYANADLAGTLFGTYRTSADGPGTADLTGHLSRGVAQRVTAYLPLTVAKSSRGWLDRAFTAGSSNDVRFRVKGDLRHFPFADERNGVFEVAAKVSGGTLFYGEGWPRITGIEGDFLFRGARLEMNAREANIGKVRLARVRAQIPDLLHHEEQLNISGEAEGATADFLAFIAESPVNGMIGGFTEDMQAQGQGRLGLKLQLPLQSLDRSKVSGSYQFINNQLVPEPGFPPLEQVNGRLDFTQDGVRVPSATATFLGGPLSVTAGSQRDAAVSIQFQGRINADAARRAGGIEWLRQIRGATDWRGSLSMRNKRVDLVVESSLQGLAVNLPAPFTKTAAEAVPLRIERRYTGPREERIAAAVGNIASVVLHRRGEGRDARIERGVLRFGEGAAGEPQRPGIAVSGVIRALDFHEWLALSGDTESRDGGPALSSVDLRIDELRVFERRFSEVGIKAAQQSGVLQANIRSPDIEGALGWRGQGKGRLTARLRRLNLPAAEPAVPAVPAQSSKAAETKAPELPGLDVLIDELLIAGRPLGKLELQAVQQQRDWRIEKLLLITPESQLNIDGLWQSWLTRPRMQANVRLDVNDIGRLLTRLGYPEGVRRGIAKIEGNLAWSGGPQKLDYPTLNGNFVLDAGKGQFLKLEPGIGKLLGILSLQSLPRRISLDFRDIFSEGLAFDEIVGAIKVTNGIASTDNLRITGPAARINMSGRVDLARETQALRVKINPQLSDTVSVAGALIGGPLAGLAAFVAQKLLRDPLDQIAAYEYDVTGTWSDPLVARVERPQPAPQETQ
ncbi:MAG: TIGR02099 family protein [Burkholderiales bacterium]|nr:TIGR02099 family protein [Burkholderiales bacterium]